MSEHGCIHTLGHCGTHLLGHGWALLMDTPVVLIRSLGLDPHG